MQRKSFIKRFFTAALLASQLMTLIPAHHAEASAPVSAIGAQHSRYNDCDWPKNQSWYGSDTQIWDIVSPLLPGGTPYKNPNGYWFDYRVWHDKGLIVYGDPSCVWQNDFKAKAGGYYTENGEAGEYRYRGFAADGSKFTNADFPNDYIAPELENLPTSWVLEPWDNRTVGNSGLPEADKKRSKYNERAYENNAYGQSADDTFLRMVAGWESAVNGEPWKYLNAQSVPSLFSVGSARGFFYRGYDLRYQTFDLPMSVKKVLPPISGGFRTLSSNAELTANDDGLGGYDNHVVHAKVKTAAWIYDYGDTSDPVDTATLYQPRDIDVSKGNNGVELTLDGSPAGVTKTSIRRNWDTGEAYFDVDLTVAQIKTLPKVAGNKYRLELHGTGRFWFYKLGYPLETPITGSIIFTLTNNSAKGGVTAAIDVSTQPEPLTAGSGKVTVIGDRSSSILNGVKTGVTHFRFWASPVQADLNDDSKGQPVTAAGGKGQALFSLSGLSSGQIIYCKVRAYDKRIADYNSDTGSELKAIDEVVDTVVVGSSGGGGPVPTKTPIPVPISVNNHIPEHAFDIVKFPASDSTDMKDVVSRTVFIDGMPVSDTMFFSGNYIFGDGTEGLKRVDCVYLTKDGLYSYSTDWVQVHSTIPNAHYQLAGPYKEARKQTATEDSDGHNDPYVNTYYPIVRDAAHVSWSISSAGTDILTGAESTALMKAFLAKKPGTYSITLTVERNVNGVRRVSKPYTVSFEVMPDYAPATICNLTASVISRTDTIGSFMYETVSTDGDSIDTASIELWYDSDNNGTYDQKLQTWDGKGSFPTYTPGKLGKYKFVINATEKYGEATLPEFTPAPRSLTKEVPFEVDNYVPMTDIYLTAPVNRPNVDLYIMADANLEATKMNWISTNRMNMNNDLRRMNILPTVNVWDMRTYVYSQGASTSLNTGTGVPPTTTGYSSNGYSGTLNRTSYSDNGNSYDLGHSETRTESRTFSGSWSNSVTDVYSKAGTLISSSQSNPAPSSLYVSEDGYSGSIPKTGASQTSWSDSVSGDGTRTVSQSWTASYSGTLSKSVSVWVSNWQWVPNYTGFYSGTIYKYVRQPYSDPWKANSTKFVVYVSDNGVSEPADLSMVRGRTDAKLITVGNAAANTATSPDKFIELSMGMDNAMKQVLAYIGQNAPAGEEQLVQVGETFSLSTAQYDSEGDPITDPQFQYVQDKDFYDNSTGMEPGAVAALSDSGWTTTLKSAMSKPGKYTIYRRVKDKPSTDPNFAGYSYYSGTPNVSLLVHRKPIASAALDWDYDSVRNVYLTRWVDSSYDLDHQYNRPDKGVVERKIQFRQDGGPWSYFIPSELTPGHSYDVNYVVRDPEGAWSDPWTYSFTLSATVPVQMKAQLKTTDDSFSLSSIPASESLTGFGLWTRYPYSVYLEMGFWNGSSWITPVKTVNFSEGVTGTKTGNDISWNDQNYTIPATLPDGPYTFRIRAVGQAGQVAYKDFAVTVRTPINLVPSVPETWVGSTDVDLRSTTSKYAGTVTAQVYRGTAFQTSVTLTGAQAGNIKNWLKTFAVSTSIPVGDYTARFTATTPNGNTESKDVNYRVEMLKITGVTISGYWNHWRGQQNIFGDWMTNEPHRFLSLEKVRIEATTIGSPDSVWFRCSPELEAGNFTDNAGNTYNMWSDYGLPVVAFPGDVTQSSPGNSIHWEYILPLARSSKDWNNVRQRGAYTLTVYAKKGSFVTSYDISDIEITGNTYDLVYIQPAE